MAESIGDDTVFVGGEVRRIRDFPDMLPEPMAEEHDEAVIDGILLGLHPHGRRRERALGYIGVRQAEVAVEPAGQPTEQEPPEPAIGHVARKIVTEYHEEKARLMKRRHAPDLVSLQRDVWVAIIRNYQDLSEADRHYIEQEAQLAEYHGYPVPPRPEQSERD